MTESKYDMFGVTDDRVDEICFKLNGFLDTMNLTNNERMILASDMIYHTVVSPHYDEKTHRVDTDKSHEDLDRLIKDAEQYIDESNDMLYINKKEERGQIPQ